MVPFDAAISYVQTTGILVLDREGQPLVGAEVYQWQQGSGKSSVVFEEDRLRSREPALVWNVRHCTDENGVAIIPVFNMQICGGPVFLFIGPLNPHLDVKAALGHKCQFAVAHKGDKEIVPLALRDGAIGEGERFRMVVVSVSAPQEYRLED